MPGAAAAPALADCGADGQLGAADVSVTDAATAARQWEQGLGSLLPAGECERAACSGCGLCAAVTSKVQHKLHRPEIDNMVFSCFLTMGSQFSYG